MPISLLSFIYCKINGSKLSLNWCIRNSPAAGSLLVLEGALCCRPTEDLRLSELTVFKKKKPEITHCSCI